MTSDAPLILYLIAGEASGDFLGAKLMQSLKQKSIRPLVFHGIGGERMQAEGLQSFFPIQELSLMGFVEVLPHIFRLKRRIRETIAHIKQINPDLLITIDSPGFTFRVAAAIEGIKKLHYVAPTVWAYKPERAEKTARLFDALLTLLPFEPPYFEAHGMTVHHVGHPVVWDWRTSGDGAAFRSEFGIPADALLIGMMPGSRKNELKHHLPAFGKAAAMLKATHPDLQIVMPLREAMLEPARQYFKHWKVPVHPIIGDAQKKDAYDACNLLLAKSGTVGLEAALSGKPTVVAYRANPISIWLIRRMVSIQFANLVNIISKREVIPELLQECCTPERITEAIEELLGNDVARHRQLAACREVFALLGAGDEASPSDKAADAVLEMAQC